MVLFNFFKVAFRNIRRQKGYSFINIFGLSIGMACGLLIMLWVMDELSYDRFHENADKLYRIEQDQDYSGSIYHVNVTPFPMAEGVKAEIPEVKYASPFPWMGTLLVNYQEKKFFEQGAKAVSQDFLKMFTFPLIYGDKNQALQNPKSIVITEEIAEKYFGKENPVGRVLLVNDRFEFTVTGVLQNIPENSVLKFNMLVPFEFMKDLGRRIDQWGWNSVMTLVHLHENSAAEEVNKKITDLRHRKVKADIDDPEDLKEFAKRKPTQFMLAELTGIHLHSYFGFSKSMGDILYVYIMSSIAGFIIFIACINFMNLSTARSANRAKEVGLRKVVGAKKANIIRQFFGESLLLAFIALLFSLAVIALVLPGFSTLADKKFTLLTLLNWKFLTGMMIVTLLTGLVSGSYPALFLSSFQPVKILRGSLNRGAKGALFRKTLVVVQFSLSILLIAGTVTVLNQLTFMKEKELGYDKEHMIYLPLRGETNKMFDVLKTEMLKSDKVINITGTNHSPIRIGSNSSGGEWDGKDPEDKVLIGFNAVDFDYVETMKIGMLEGRSFNKSFTSDTSDAFMINKTLADIIGGGSVVNKRFKFLGTEGKIIGVMQNYHFQSMMTSIEPLAVYLNKNSINNLVIRLAAGDIPAGIEDVKAKWQEIIPSYPFDYKFVDQELDQMYSGWERLSSLLKYFSAVAIMIACLGLFGLASFTSEQRTKEIGIRKVLGASAGSIVLIMSKDFTKWVLIANLIALPFAYWIMNNWLQSFAYRIDLGIWTFLLSAVTAVIIALVTVMYQSVRAAVSNPAVSIRYE